MVAFHVPFFCGGAFDSIKMVVMSFGTEWVECRTRHFNEMTVNMIIFGEIMYILYNTYFCFEISKEYERYLRHLRPC